MDRTNIIDPEVYEKIRKIGEAYHTAGQNAAKDIIKELDPKNNELPLICIASTPVCAPCPACPVAVPEYVIFNGFLA